MLSIVLHDLSQTKKYESYLYGLDFSEFVFSWKENYIIQIYDHKVSKLGWIKGAMWVSINM